MNIVDAIKPYIYLMRLNRPIGILLLLWPTLIALWLASNGKPDYKIVSIFVLGVIVMRSAGCVINDYADRDIDPFVSRTKNRPLANGTITVHRARILFTLLMLIAFILVVHLSFYTIALSSVGAILAILYPYAKRFTSYPQIVLGMAFGWSIPMVYAQVQHSLDIQTWLLYLSNLLWVVAYDTEYAMVDKEDDLKIGVKSTAIAFGRYDQIIILCLQLLCIMGYVIIGILNQLNQYYYIGLALAVALIIYQQWLIKDRLQDKCMQAFLNNAYLGAAIFAGVIAALY